MAVTKLRFGICGLGCMGRGYFARLQRHPHAEIVALCDRDPQRRAGNWNDAAGNLEAIRTEGGRVDLAPYRVFATTEELVAQTDVDAVVLALPSWLHADAACHALAAGKHVLCEKPMALNTADCDRMIAAARQAGRTLMVAQCIRFWPQYEMIKRWTDEGRLGAVRYASLRRLASPPTYSAEQWMMACERSGGGILDLHVHDVDFARHLFGMPATIAACGHRGPSGGIDHVIATYAYADGRYAVVEGGWCLHAPWPFQMEITVHGEKATLDWSLAQGDCVLHYAGGGAAERIDCGHASAYQRELDYFIACVRMGRPVTRCLPESTRLSIALAELEARAVDTGERVRVGGPLGA